MINQIERALAEVMHLLPQQIGLIAVNFAKQRFVDQNWLNTSAQPWEKRKRRRRGGKKRQNGAVLVDSGRLKRSIRIISVTSDSVTIGTDVPYAQVHNDGYLGFQSVKAHTRKGRNVKAHIRMMDMPRRRFLGDSHDLVAQIEKFITDEIKNATK